MVGLFINFKESFLERTKNVSSGLDIMTPWFQLQGYNYFAVGPWTSPSTSMGFSFLSSKMGDLDQIIYKIPSNFSCPLPDQTLPIVLHKRRAEQCSLSPFYRWGSWGSMNWSPSLNLTFSVKPLLTTTLPRPGPHIYALIAPLYFSILALLLFYFCQELNKSSVAKNI